MLPEIAELHARAAQLRALADEIDTIVDPALTAARKPGWECPSADDVRARLVAFQRASHSAADQLRAEALRATSQAATLLERQREAQAKTPAR